MKSTGYNDIIRKSPFGPIKAHMEVSTNSVDELLRFIEFVVAFKFRIKGQGNIKIF